MDTQKENDRTRETVAKFGSKTLKTEITETKINRNIDR